jgi:hypothetical protein
MKPLLALLAIAGLSVGASACGGASTGTHPSPPASATAGTTGSTATASTSTTAATPDFTKADADRDNDIGVIGDDKSNVSALGFGHEASPPDKRAVTALVKRYYAAALAGRGARACSLLYSPFAEATPEDYGQVPGPLYMRGAHTCAAVMTRLFAHFHRQLAVQVPRLGGVTHVRLQGGRGTALLGFAGMPERAISVAREGHTWKIFELLDGELP